MCPSGSWSLPAPFRSVPINLAWGSEPPASETGAAPAGNSLIYPKPLLKHSTVLPPSTCRSIPCSSAVCEGKEMRDQGQKGLCCQQKRFRFASNAVKATAGVGLPSGHQGMEILQVKLQGQDREGQGVELLKKRVQG